MLAEIRETWGVQKGLTATTTAPATLSPNTEDDNGNPITAYSVTQTGSQLWSTGLTFTVSANTALVLAL